MNGASRVASIEAGRERAYSGKATGVAFPFEPSKKHTQQDEGGVVQDEEERKVITERRRARIHDFVKKIRRKQMEYPRSPLL